MNSLRKLSISGLLLLGLAAGCASNGWRTENIPYPRTTPFDSNEFGRAAYLDGFERGYHAEIVGTPASLESLTDSYPLALRQGFFAGVAQARAEKLPVAQNDAP